jgi:hypothetical protein
MLMPATPRFLSDRPDVPRRRRNGCMHAPDAYKKVKETMDGEKEIPTYLTGFRVSET